MNDYFRKEKCKRVKNVINLEKEKKEGWRVLCGDRGKCRARAEV